MYFIQTKHSIIKQNNKKWLGQNLNAVIYNGHYDFNPETLLMLSGCIQARGTLFLLTPLLPLWSKQITPSYRALLSYGTSPKKQQDFIYWLSNKLLSSSVVKHFSQEKNTHTDISILAHFSKTNRTQTNCQIKAQKAICQLFFNKKKYPLIITGKRGRGKSALLGITAKELITQYHANIIITSMNRDAIKQVQKHSTPNHLPFYSPDYLLANPIQAQLLYIDEAATMPSALLYKLAQHYPGIILTTTIEGYEGTALGFQFKVVPFLKKNYPNTKTITLHEGIRWETPCALENFLAHTFFLNQIISTKNNYSYNPKLKLEFSLLSTKELITHHEKLTAIYTLLKQAHYRTTLNDLRQLMDDPDLLISTVSHEQKILGIIQAIPEGNISKTLAQQISLGHRRIQGHLLVQSLGLHLQSNDLLLQKSYRIQRICITPQWQNQNLGTQLIHYTLNKLSKKKIDFCSVSFGAEKKLMRFWQKNNFQTMRIGYKPGTATGLYSLFMIHPLGKTSSQLAKQLKKTWAQQIQVFLKYNTTNWPCFLLPSKSISQPINHQEKNNLYLSNFIHHSIPLITTLPYLLPVLKKNKNQLKDDRIFNCLYIYFFQPQLRHTLEKTTPEF